MRIRNIVTFILLGFFLVVLSGCGPREVTLTFRTNGGNAIPSMTFDQGSVILSVPDATRTGYSFLGWFEDQEFETPFEGEKQILRNMTIHAKWEINQYTLTFNTNSDISIDSITADYQTNLNIPSLLEREGYVFLGWYLDANFLAPLQYTRMPAEDINIYARWELLEYQVTFFVNGEVYTTRYVNHGGSIEMLPVVPNVVGKQGIWDLDDFTNITEDLEVYAVYSDLEFEVVIQDQWGTVYGTQTVTYGDLISNLVEEPHKEGYLFMGYSEDITTFQVFEDTIIEAIFQIRTYSVEFFGFNGEPLANRTVAWGNAATAPQVTVPSGYAFIGWDKVFTDVRENLQVHAIITPNNYTMSFFALAGTFSNGTNTKSIEASYGSVIGTQENPTRTGYTFSGWYNNPEFTGQPILFSAQSTMPIGGLDLFAKYTANTYTITFNAQGGSVSPSSKTVTFDTAVGTLPNPTKTGHTFLHWIDQSNQVVTADTVYFIDQSSTLTAVYTINQYTIDFRVDGNSIETLTLDFHTLLDNSMIPTIPTKTHYTDTAPIWSVDLVGELVVGNLIVHAQYTPNQYTITFDSLGGDGSPLPITQAYLSVITEPLEPTKEGYSFGGWIIENETESFIFDRMPGGNIVLYAIWTEWPVIEFELQGGSGLSNISLEPGTPLTNVAVPNKAGYIFAGWYLDSDFTTAYEFSVMPNESISVYSKWDLGEANYTVEIYLQNIDANTYSSIPSQNIVITSQTESVVTYTPVEIYGFSIDLGAENILSGSVAGNGSLVLRVYYARNLYTTTLYYQDSLQEETIVLEQNPYESMMAFILTQQPIREGYTFSHWIDIFGNTISETTSVSEDLAIFAQWIQKTYTISGKNIFSLRDLDTGEVESDGEDIHFSYQNIIHGTELTLATFFEGYDFVKFIYNDVEYTSEEDILIATSNMEDIQVFYERKVLTITFVQGYDETTIQEDIRYVHYNENLVGAIPELLPREGYDIVVWDRTLFMNIRENILVRSLYSTSSVKSITFVDGGIIRFIASEIDDVEDQFLTSASPLFALKKTGYQFLGWFDAPSGGTMLTAEDMKFSHFASSTQLYARWQALDSFATPTNLDVSVNVEQEITLTWNQSISMIGGVGPYMYRLFLNGTHIDILPGLVTIVGEEASITILPGDDLYSSIQSVLLPGLHTVAVQILGDNIHHLSSAFSDTIQFSVDTEIEGDVTDVAIYDYFIVESVQINQQSTKRYVFYTDMTYNFSDRYHFEIINGQELLEANGNQLRMYNIPGNFRFTMSIDGGSPVIYEGRIVKNINQFAFGNHYQRYLSETENEDTSYLKDTSDPFYVGFRNDFYLDLRMIDNRGSRVSLFDAMLVYEFYLDGSQTPLTSTQQNQYATILANNVIVFTQAAANHTFRIRVMPRYQALMMQVDPLDYEVSVNDGHNAFNNQQLRLLFSDMNVNTINIQANIEAQLSNNQLNSDGSPINRFALPTDTRMGNVYARLHNQTQSETFTVNGNYMSIDGSKLPFSNKNSGSGLVGFADSFEIVSVQIGIFYYNVIHESSFAKGINDNEFNIRNLTILGNTTTPNINYGQSSEDILLQEQLMARNSGGYLGIVVRNGTSYIDNVRIGFTVIGLTGNAYGNTSNESPVLMHVSDTEIFDSWANSVYLHAATGIYLSKSHIKQSGGAAIHLVDARIDQGVGNPTLYISDDTVIENWISGDEAWFKAYGMSQVAIQLKSAIQNGVSPIGKTIIKEVVNPVTGLTTEMINLILLTEPSKGAVDNVNEPTTGSEIRLILEDQLQTFDFTRPFNFLSTPDPRISSGSFVFPVGMYSLLPDFMSAIYTAMGYGLNQAQAVDTATLAAFYNLSVEEAMQMGQLIPSMGFVGAVEAIKGSNHAYPRYLEVATAVPLFETGQSIVLIELFNQ